MCGCHFWPNSVWRNNKETYFGVSLKITNDLDSILPTFRQGLAESNHLTEQLYTRWLPYLLTRPKIENLRTAEKSRGWLEFWRFLDQIDRVGANYFSKNFPTNERTNKQTNCLVAIYFSKKIRTDETNEHISKNSEKNFRKRFEISILNYFSYSGGV